MAELYVDSRLHIKNYTKSMFEWAKEKLVFDNPKFIKTEALGKWTGNIQRYIYMYEIRDNWLILPFGCFKDFYMLFKNQLSVVKSLISPTRAVNYESHINLYDYQETAVNRLLSAKNGVVVAPCGSGKTQMGVELVARLGLKTLWIAHTHDLVQQSMERAKANFGLDIEKFGKIAQGKVKIGDITFATAQTLCGLDLPLYKNEWDVIVVDECHHIYKGDNSLAMFYKILSNLSARYRFGLTATPKRADGLERCMTALLGNIEHTIPKEEVKKFTCPVKVMKVETEYKPNLDVVLAGDGTIVYSSLINDLIQNQKRNVQIAKDIDRILDKEPDARILILSDRVEHLATIKRTLVDGFCPSKWNKVKQLMALSNSKKAREERRQVLKDLNDGKTNVVLATYALAKEGLDVPKLDYVVFASPQKDETTVTQSAGRVGRKAEGKEYGTVIDYVDMNFGMLAGFWKKRNSVYKKLEYEIM